MEVMLILIPVTVALVAFALWGFVWSVRNEQFEDLDKQAYSILFDQSETEPEDTVKSTAPDQTDSSRENPL